MLAQAPHPNSRDTRAATRLQTGQCWGLTLLFMLFGASSTKGHGVGGAGSVCWQENLALALGNTLWSETSF